jgi:hypothetical protein
MEMQYCRRSTHDHASQNNAWHNGHRPLRHENLRRLPGPQDAVSTMIWFGIRLRRFHFAGRTDIVPDWTGSNPSPWQLPVFSHDAASYRRGRRTRNASGASSHPINSRVDKAPMRHRN